MGVFVVPIAIAIIVLVIVARALVVVPPDTAYVIEQLGRATKVLQPGLHVITPLVERVASRVPLGNQTLDVPQVSNPLRSGGEASVSGTVTIRVLDPLRAVADVADYRTALVTLVAASWQRAIAESDCVSAASRIRATDASIHEAAGGWGLALVEMQPSIQLSDDARDRLMARAEEERETRVLAWLTTRGERPGDADGRRMGSGRRISDGSIARSRPTPKRSRERSAWPSRFDKTHGHLGLQHRGARSTQSWIV